MHRSSATRSIVIPAKAGIQPDILALDESWLGAGLRRHDFGLVVWVWQANRRRQRKP